MHISPAAMIENSFTLSNSCTFTISLLSILVALFKSAWTRSKHFQPSKTLERDVIGVKGTPRSLGAPRLHVSDKDDDIDKNTNKVYKRIKGTLYICKCCDFNNENYYTKDDGCVQYVVWQFEGAWLHWDSHGSEFNARHREPACTQPITTCPAHTAPHTPICTDNEDAVMIRMQMT